MHDKPLSLERILLDEDRLRRWHQPRVDHVELTRLIRDLSEGTAVPLDERNKMVVKAATKIITARPYLTWKWALGSLAAQPFLYRNPYSAEAQAQHLPGKKPLEEYLAYGITSQVDALRARRGQADPRRFDAAGQILSGSYAWRPSIHREGKELFFDIDFYDPATVYWLPGRMGMQIVLRSVKMTQLEAAVFVEKSGGKLRRVTGKETDPVWYVEYWAQEGGKVYQAVMVSGAQPGSAEALSKSDLALPFEEQEGLTQIPILCGCVNAQGNETPSSNWGGMADGPRTIGSFGRSVIDPMIRAAQQSNLLSSLGVMVVRDSLVPAEVSKTRGRRGVDNTAKLGEKVQVDVDTGEDWGYVAKPIPGWAIDRVAARYQQELDEAGASPASLGDLTPMPPSALTAETARFNAENVKLPVFAEAFRLLERETMMAWIRLFKEEDGEVHLEGRHLEQAGIDGHFARAFKPGELQKGYWELDVEHKIARPMDEAAVFNVANSKYMARFISRRQAQEEAGVADPEGEDEQRMREQIQDSPIWVMRRQVNALEDLMLNARREGDEEAAADYEREFFAADRARAAMLAGATVQAAQAQPGMMAEQPNAPLEAPNPSPAIQPPEARGQGREQKRLEAFNLSRNGGK